MTATALRTHLWRDMTRDEIAAARDSGALVVVPVGAIEQHGTHLAVDTDDFLAAQVSRLAAQRVTSTPVIVAPSLAFGFSPHHLSHAGTISLRLETYLGVLHDIARSVLDTGFQRVVFVNGHGGNSAPLRSLVTQLVTDGHAVASVDYFGVGQSEWTRLLKGGLLRPGHACEQETALSLVLRENPGEAQRIRQAIEKLPARLSQPWVGEGSDGDPVTEAGAAWPPVFYAGDCGYFGDPAAARRDTGEQILEVSVSGLAKFLAAFATIKLPAPTR